MDEIVCPGCGGKVSLAGLKIGDRIDCQNCANLTLKLTEKDGRLLLAEVPKVSCPLCERVIEVTEGLGCGNTVICCGEKFTLTYKFGSYALVR